MAHSDLWCMNVKGRVYGPYDTDQMRRFVEEKRLAYHSQVAPAGSRDFRDAFQFAELRPFFRPADSRDAARRAAPTGPALLVVFGTRSAAAQAEHAFLNEVDAAIPLSGTAYILRCGDDEDTLRERLSRSIPGGERLFVFRLGSGARPSAVGVSLEELDRMNRLLAQG